MLKIIIKKEMVSKILIIKNQQILVLERSDNLVRPSSPWTLDLPGGHIEPGETPKESAIRETLEETQLSVGLLKFLGKEKSKGKTIYFYTSE